MDKKRKRDDEDGGISPTQNQGRVGYGVHITKSNGDVRFVPRTLYDMFYASLLLEEEIKNVNNKKLEKVLDDMFELSFDEQLRRYEEKPILQKLLSAPMMRLSDKFNFDSAWKMFERCEKIKQRVNEEFLLRYEGVTNEEVFEDVYTRLTVTTKENMENIDSFHLLYKFMDEYGDFSLRNHKDFLKRVIAFEGSVKENENVLYRGANYDKEKDHDCYSRSFGISLFAGLQYDDTACVLYYLNNKKNCYIFSISYDDPRFYIPPDIYLHEIVSIYGAGEMFHARSLVSKDCISPGTMITGYAGINPPSRLLVQKPKKEVLEEWVNFLVEFIDDPQSGRAYKYTNMFPYYVDSDSE